MEPMNNEARPYFGVFCLFFSVFTSDIGIKYSSLVMLLIEVSMRIILVT